MEHFLGEGWSVQPAGGATGEAFIAQQGEQTVFLKRNSSPFLAVLSAEGIVPKLLWTRRLENGDVVTAQRWISGRKLNAHEMKESRVANLLAKIHGSSELLDMFNRIGNEPLTPSIIVENLANRLHSFRINDDLIAAAMTYLFKEIDNVQYDKTAVCHCDMNHNNWILDEEDQLFLIDWDGATVSDPALDLGRLLYSYVPEHEWEAWLDQYGLSLGDTLRERMHWYVVAQSIVELLWHYERSYNGRVKEIKKELQDLLNNNKNSPHSRG